MPMYYSFCLATMSAAEVRVEVKSKRPAAVVIFPAVASLPAMMPAGVAGVPRNRHKPEQEAAEATEATVTGGLLLLDHSRCSLP